MMFPKPRPRALEKQDRQRDQARIDREQRALCRERSLGRCEMRERVGTRTIRCKREATENHHLLGGNGRRNKGRSILAVHRQDLCMRCHREIGGDIGGKVLFPIGPFPEDAALVVYERKV